MLARFAKDCALRLRHSVPAASRSSSLGYATVADGLKYAKDHEWVKVEGSTATVGITDFAQEELGDLVYVELPEVGATVTAGERFGVVESVKAASDINSPITGEVLEVNAALADDASQVNTAPFEGGWMIKVKLANTKELDDLMEPAAYSAFCESGGH